MDVTDDYDASHLLSSSSFVIARGHWPRPLEDDDDDGQAVDIVIVRQLGLVVASMWTSSVSSDIHVVLRRRLTPDNIG